MSQFQLGHCCGWSSTQPRSGNSFSQACDAFRELVYFADGRPTYEQHEEQQKAVVTKTA
jgi:hypothetical protein